MPQHNPCQLHAPAICPLPAVSHLLRARGPWLTHPRQWIPAGTRVAVPRENRQQVGVPGEEDNDRREPSNAGS